MKYETNGRNAAAPTAAPQPPSTAAIAEMVRRWAMVDRSLAEAQDLLQHITAALFGQEPPMVRPPPGSRGPGS